MCFEACSAVTVSFMKFLEGFLSAVTFVLLIGCSEYPEMDKDILAYHVFSENAIDLENSDEEYLKLVAQSFGMSTKDVQNLQKNILSKKTTSNLVYSYEASIHGKIVELLDKKGSAAKKEYVVNVLAPYLDALSKGQPYKSGIDRSIFEEDLCALFNDFFNVPQGSNPLHDFIDDVYRYNHGGTSNADNLNRINNILVYNGLYIDWNEQSNLNVLKVQDAILPNTQYKDKTISIIKLKRIVPGLMPVKLGYYTAGSNQVVVLEDMVRFNADEKIKEVELGKNFSKYDDRRFEKFWHSIGLDLNVQKASRIYSALLKKDFLGKKKNFIQQSLEIETTLHEGKHFVDQIEHPELSLNLDMEFSAHITSAIFNPAPNVVLLSAIQRMEKYAMYHSLSNLNNVVRQLWEVAKRSANEELYTNDSLRKDLIEIYDNYRTIREHASFESLKDFCDDIVSPTMSHYHIESFECNSF